MHGTCNRVSQFSSIVIDNITVQIYALIIENSDIEEKSRLSAALCDFVALRGIPFSYSISLLTNLMFAVEYSGHGFVYNLKDGMFHCWLYDASDTGVYAYHFVLEPINGHTLVLKLISPQGDSRHQSN